MTAQLYRVWMTSRSGFYAQYDGYVDVLSETGEWRFVNCAAHHSLTERPACGAWSGRNCCAPQPNIRTLPLQDVRSGAPIAKFGAESL